MKIKNIIWVFLAALAFTSCSKDNGGEDILQDPVDAVISITAKAIGSTTRADANVVGTKEERIESLSAYIFKEGSLVGYKRDVAKGDASISEIEGILIKIIPGATDQQFMLVLLANTAELTFNSLSELQAATGLGGALKGYKVGSSFLPMVSNELTFTGVKKSEKDTNGNYITNNWVLPNGGDVASSKGEATEIPLTRMMARIEVNEVRVELGDKYPGATFALETIALVNVRSGVNSALKGIGNYVKGYQSEGYNYLPYPDGGWWIPTNTPESGQKETTLEPSLHQVYSGFAGIATGGFTFGDPIAAPSVGNPLFYRYVFPNSPKSGDNEYETGIVVGGTFTYQSGITALKHFIVKLNDPMATAADKKANQVLANTVYKVNILISGEGSEDENHPQETAGITATISVADWKLITQEEELPPIKPE